MIGYATHLGMEVLYSIILMVNAPWKCDIRTKWPWCAISPTKSLTALRSHIRVPNETSEKIEEVVENTINSNVRAYHVLDIPQPEP
jgi:hypothetical protein